MSGAGVHTLTVEPLDFGWSLKVSGLCEMLFRSGAAAEAAARRLATRLAMAGEPAKLVLRLRDGSIAGRFLAPPSPSPQLRPSLLEAA